MFSNKAFEKKLRDAIEQGYETDSSRSIQDESTMKPSTSYEWPTKQAYKDYKQIAEEEGINKSLELELKLREIKTIKNLVKQDKLQIEIEKEKPKGACAENKIEILERTVKIFKDEIKLLKKKFEISRVNAANVLERDAKLLNRLKPQTEKDKIENKEELIPVLRQKNKEGDAGRMETLQSIAKRYKDNIDEIQQRIQGTELIAIQEKNEIYLAIKTSTQRFNENRFPYEKDINELKNLEAIDPVNLTNSIQKRIAELRKKNPENKKALKTLEVNKLKELREFHSQLEQANHMLAEQIDSYKKISQIEEITLKEIRELIAIETVKEQLAGDLSKGNASTSAALPTSESQLKEISEEGRLKKVEFYNRLINEAKKTLESCEETLKSSNEEGPTEILATMKMKNAKKSIENFSYEQYGLMGVPVEPSRHGMVLGVSCIVEDKKSESVVQKGSSVQIVENSSTLTNQKEFKEKEVFDWKRTGTIRKKPVAPNSETTIPQVSTLSAIRSSYKELLEKEARCFPSAGSWASLYSSTAQPQEEKEAKKQNLKGQTNVMGIKNN